MELSYENKEEIVSSIVSQVSLVKCDMMDVENYYSKDMPEHAFRELYRRLDAELKRRKLIDFDDMMVLCYELLTARPDILDKCRSLFPYIMVDEFQDSNRIQYEIFRMLANPRQNACIVGDDDQSVYGFRGARPEIMQQFRKDFSSCEIVYLGENYRSDYRIVQAATQVIEKNQTRYKKQLKAVSKEPGIVQMHTVKDEAEENECIIRRIREQYQAGIAYEKQAVLYRTNLQPRRLAYKLNQYNIPYTLSDALPNLFDHFAVRYVLDYMRIAMGDTSRATFLRIINMLMTSQFITMNLLFQVIRIIIQFVI
jgi:DNA helicase-2/ATP-dependent DNA helicase PcrA